MEEKHTQKPGELNSAFNREEKNHTSAEKKHSHALWYVLGALALVLILVAAAIINNNLGTEPTDAGLSSGGLALDNGDTKINWDKYGSYDVDLSANGALTVTTSGTYHLTGELTDGMVVVNAEDAKVRLILDNVTIKNSNGPAILCYAADDLVIELIGENYVEDGKTYDASLDEDVKGAIYSKDDLSFTGDGTLTLVANYQDGIVGKDDLKFNSGTYAITAADDGIRGKDSVYIVDGTFTISAKGDGIKSTNETDAGKGFVLIENGDITIAAGDDGIHAYNSLLIYDGKVTVTKSYEGLESQKITINGGEIAVTASDDGINAGGGSDSTTATAGRPGGMMDSNENCVLTINGGNVYVNASGDGVDSNGYINFNGGTVVIDGPTSNGDGALDSGISIVMNGGTVIAVGASGMAETLGTSSSVYNASIYLASAASAGTKIEIKNAAGETVVSHTSVKAFNHIAVGTEAFKQGETYTVYLNGTASTSFTISSIVTTVGNSNQNFNNFNGGQGGGMRR